MVLSFPAVFLIRTKLSTALWCVARFKCSFLSFLRAALIWMKRRLKERLSSRKGIKVWTINHKTDAKSNLGTACAKAKNMKILFSKLYAITETTSHECLVSVCLIFLILLMWCTEKRAPVDQAERKLQKFFLMPREVRRYSRPFCRVICVPC